MKGCQGDPGDSGLPGLPGLPGKRGPTVFPSKYVINQAIR